MVALYALIDRDSLLQKGISLSALIKTINKLNAPIVQYRAKNISTTQRINDLKLIRSLYRGKIIVNDDMDAMEYADGLHLGQEDLLNFSNQQEEAIKSIRHQIGNKILGISTHNQDEILQANRLDVEYIGLGAYRSTSTKKEAKVGEKLLEIAKLSNHPVALIGGVRVEEHFDEEIITYQVVGSDLFNYISN